VLTKADDVYRMFGNAAALIGAGMLAFGGMVDLVDKLGEQTGGPALIGLGAVAALVSARIFSRSPSHAKFLTGSLTVMGMGLHIAGLYLWGGAADVSGLPV
jgi:hypothetical protein